MACYLLGEGGGTRTEQMLVSGTACKLYMVHTHSRFGSAWWPGATGKGKPSLMGLEGP